MGKKSEGQNADDKLLFSLAKRLMWIVKTVSQHHGRFLNLQIQRDGF